METKYNKIDELINNPKNTVNYILTELIKLNICISGSEVRNMNLDLSDHEKIKKRRQIITYYKWINSGLNLIPKHQFTNANLVDAIDKINLKLKHYIS